MTQAAPQMRAGETEARGGSLLEATWDAAVGRWRCPVRIFPAGVHQSWPVGCRLAWLGVFGCLAVDVGTVLRVILGEGGSSQQT